jgi:hypothetical protein
MFLLKEKLPINFYEKFQPVYLVNYDKPNFENVHHYYLLILTSILTVINLFFFYKKKILINKFSLIYFFLILIIVITIIYPFFFLKLISAAPQPHLMIYRIGIFQLALFFVINLSYIILISKKFMIKKIRALFFYKVLKYLIMLSLITYSIKYKNLPDPSLFLVNPEQLKTISKIKDRQNEGPCVISTINEQMKYFVLHNTNCYSLTANIFNSSIEIDEVIERYILAFILADRDLNTVLKSFGFSKDLIVKNNVVSCADELNKNIPISSRLSVPNLIFHGSACVPSELYKNVLNKYNKILLNKDFYKKKYKVSHIIS